MSLPLLAVDIGNTNLKVGVMTAAPQGGLPIVERSLSLPTAGGEFDGLEAWLPPSPVRWLVASVQRAAGSRLATWVASHRPSDDYRRLSHRDIPLQIDVERPERVGLDRLAAALAANALRPADEAAIVIDAGSAVTVDALSRDGAFLGGAILPGLQMAARSLNEQTDLLPQVLIDPAAPPDPIGRSTEQAIASGLYWGLVGSIKELVAQTTARLGGAPLVVLGGGAGHLLPSMLPAATSVSDLVLRGIALLAVDTAK